MPNVRFAPEGWVFVRPVVLPTATARLARRSRFSGRREPATMRSEGKVAAIVAERGADA
jgi:hypothetical protein